MGLLLSVAQTNDEDSQDPVEALVEAIEVRHIGPGTMSGRVTARCNCPTTSPR